MLNDAETDSEHVPIPIDLQTRTLEVERDSLADTEALNDAETDSETLADVD